MHFINKFIDDHNRPHTKHYLITNRKMTRECSNEAKGTILGIENDTSMWNMHRNENDKTRNAYCNSSLNCTKQRNRIKIMEKFINFTNDGMCVWCSLVICCATVLIDLDQNYQQYIPWLIFNNRRRVVSVILINVLVDFERHRRSILAEWNTWIQFEWQFESSPTIQNIFSLRIFTHALKIPRF